MKIITPGDAERAKKFKEVTEQFSCDICGCVFEAEYGEYWSETDRNDIYYNCKCPTCGRVVTFWR